MKCVSFNINSLRARIPQLEAIIKTHDPDVIGLQETKVHDDEFPVSALEHLGYHLSYFGQKGHYGVALLTKEKPIEVIYGFPNDDETAQRRLITAILPSKQGNITVINGYFPQGESRHHETKFPAKAKFYADLNQFILNKKFNLTETIIMGDLNISATELDIGLKPENKKRWLQTGKCSFLPEEREWLNRLLELGFIDVYREKHPDSTDYSWFDYRSKGIESNIGLRIDLILATPKLAQNCSASEIDLVIRKMEKPSDHAPIWAAFDI